jgi:hypothetical protein
MGTATEDRMLNGPEVGTVGAVVVGARLVVVEVVGVPGGGPLPELLGDDEQAARRDPVAISERARPESRWALEVFGILPIVVRRARSRRSLTGRDRQNLGGQDRRMAA